MPAIRYSRNQDKNWIYQYDITTGDGGVGYSLFSCYLSTVKSKKSDENAHLQSTDKNLLHSLAFPKKIIRIKGVVN